MGQRVTPAEHIRLLRAELTQRFGFQKRPGRLDEMEIPGTDIGVSVAYGCFAVRVRLLRGRTWVGRPFYFNVGDIRTAPLRLAVYSMIKETNADLLRASD